MKQLCPICGYEIDVGWSPELFLYDHALICHTDLWAGGATKCWCGVIVEHQKGDPLFVAWRKHLEENGGLAEHYIGSAIEDVIQ